MNEDLQYPKFDEDGKVICQICGEPFKVISVRHLSKHKVSMQQYKMRYPEAALVSDAFKIRQKYAKTGHGIIEEPDSDKKPEPIVDDELKFPEEVLLVEPDPYTEELKEIKRKKDPIKNQRARILEHLQIYFPHVQENYMIQHFTSGKFLEFECITDYADPVLKVNIQFPKTFWHNRGSYVDHHRDAKLSRSGWKIFTINTNPPSLNDIDDVVNPKN